MRPTDVPLPDLRFLFAPAKVDPPPLRDHSRQRQIAESSATAYVDFIARARAEVDPHRAFVDGFMTAMETLLTGKARPDDG